ncbi:MAG TPA: quinone oxidoreductase [Thermoanaerobaculia bacterium]|jgi:NADPH2:quinone reductase|nr:quinone oxidoreductase [Thermoanaerobaculia bacterium]
MKAIRVSQLGGPEVLQYVDVDDPKPAAGEALVRIEAIGVNFIDVYHRTGLYKLPLPFTPGSEAAGVVEAVGNGVDSVKKGDRVAYAMVRGAYAQFAVAPADKLVPLPDAIDAKTAAAAMLQGMTAHYLSTSVHPIAAGETVLVHAASGGVGALLVQMAKMRGARVFGTASTKHLHIAREAGCDVVIDYTKDDFESIVMAETAGKGCNAVYDSVGRTTFDKSLECCGLRATLGLFGQSSGTVPPFDPGRLAKNGVFLTRPSLGHYTHTREELLDRSREVLEWIGSGRLTLRIDREVPLHDAAEAHRALEARETTGKVLLIP